MPRPGRLLAPSVAAAVIVAAVSAAGCGQGGPAPGTSGGLLAWLHVVDPSGGLPYLADPSGRRVFLRGVAASGFEDQVYTGSHGTTPDYPVDPAAYTGGRCPPNDQGTATPPLCSVDLAQMHRAGFNVVRLTINWSELEPSPGHYSAIFLDRVAQVVRWARNQDVYVLLDMHQDSYSRFLASPADAASPVTAPHGCAAFEGHDGAPQWATFTDGRPACSTGGLGQVNAAVGTAFGNFWANRTVGSPALSAPGPGLEDHYIGALAALARRFSHEPAVIGYEIMNEPLPGSVDGLPLANLAHFSDATLFPFYARVVDALTGERDGLATCPPSNPSGLSPGLQTQPAPCAYPDLGVHATRQVFVVEPVQYRDALDFAPVPARPFTRFRNVAYAPHQYTHVFTVDTLAHSFGATSSVDYPPGYDFALRTAIGEAGSLNSALLPTEYGDAPSDDGTILTGMVAAQKAAGTDLSGSILWTWKENCGMRPGGRGPCPNGWGVYAPAPAGSTSASGPVDSARVRLVDTLGSPAAPTLESLDFGDAKTTLYDAFSPLSSSSSPGDRSAEGVAAGLFAALLGSP